MIHAVVIVEDAMVVIDEVGVPQGGNKWSLLLRSKDYKTGNWCSTTVTYEQVAQILFAMFNGGPHNKAPKQEYEELDELFKGWGQARPIP